MRQRGSETNLGQNARFCRRLPHRLTASLCNCLERTMIPGELFPASGEIEINGGRPTITLTVANTGDRPIQVGSHYHFYETNTALAFDRDQARGFRLDIPAGSATRFEPGQSREVTLVAYAGERRAVGFNGKVNGRI